MSNRASFITDLVMIFVFALLARIAHNSQDLPLSFLGVLNTAWPFWLGMLLAWAYIAYRRLTGAAVSPAGLIAWIASVIVGLAIWGIKHQAVPHWSFIIVASVTSAILFLGWRGIARLRARKAAA
ncbi:DUF3054 domain-containing protein [Corynebacterium uropygiale]|uniref:DUF3054 domain-containing protein n=1 Tax=Corynebacterium uropygiale TaxID=1775911 RepID=A0A9X1TZV6_9CORY|nr:DUF3054 domain-containing protein [Corynebacterium uropygiale]MCF4007326.1 DUF3054 domain-containing protein [Corynebacterium uropygiale]